MRVIDVAKDFSEFPAGRYKKEGPKSGEEFRDDVLAPLVASAIKIQDKIKISLDGTEGYGSSFLEEVFGGLVRKGFKPDILQQTIVLETTDDELRKEILEYINQAEK